MKSFLIITRWTKWGTNMEFDLHRVKKITAIPIGGKSEHYYREIFFEMENGEKLVINVYSNEQKKLIIKKQND